MQEQPSTKRVQNFTKHCDEYLLSLILCLDSKSEEKRKEGKGKERKGKKGDGREGKDSIVCIGRKERGKKGISFYF